MCAGKKVILIPIYHQFFSFQYLLSSGILLVVSDARQEGEREREAKELLQEEEHREKQGLNLVNWHQLRGIGED